MEQLHADLSLNINQLTNLDIGVWNTPEGQTFVDGKFRSIFLPDSSCNSNSVDQLSLTKAIKRRSKEKMRILLNGTQKSDSHWLRRKAQPFLHCLNRSRV